MNLKEKYETAYLGLGSNLGNRLEYIEKAIELIAKIDGIKISNKSQVYETEPWGVKTQGFFLNMAIEIKTTIAPEELIKLLKKIEVDLGRKNRERWNEREIDIDILFYSDVVYSSDELKIPHPELQNRKFVIEPLNEIAPDFMHPVLKKSVSLMLKEIKI